MVDNHKQEWREDTASDARVLVCLFRDIMEENGIRHSARSASITSRRSATTSTGCRPNTGRAVA
jgi:hypothetical protein